MGSHFKEQDQQFLHLRVTTFLASTLFKMNEQLFFSLFQHSNWSISRGSKHKVSNMRYCKTPNVVKMSIKWLDLFVGVSIKVFDSIILSTSKEVVCVFNKFYWCNCFLMCKNGLMTISKIKSPKLDVFISRGCCNKSVIWRNIEVLDWKTMTIEW